MADVKKFPFPCKMYFVAEVKHYTFCEWSDDGKSFIVDLDAFERYLEKSESCFQFKDRYGLMKNLDEFQFKLLKTETVGSDIRLHYFHECFQKERMDLLSHIHRYTFMLEDLGPVDSNDGAQATNKNSSTDRSSGTDDPCFKQFDSITESEKLRFVLHTNVAYGKLSKQLAIVQKADEIQRCGATLDLNAEDREILKVAKDAVNAAYVHVPTDEHDVTKHAKSGVDENLFDEFYDGFRPKFDKKNNQVQIEFPNGYSPNDHDHGPSSNRSAAKNRRSDSKDCLRL